MKTNTFIFNFINPSRLVYENQSKSRENPTITPSGTAPEALTAEQKHEQAVKKAEEEHKKAWEEELKAIDKLAKARQGGKSEDIAKNVQLVADASVKRQEAGSALAELRGSELKNPWPEKKVVVAENPTKEMMAKIIEENPDKMFNIRRLLQDFVREGYEYNKGQSRKWNNKVLAILGKTNESSADKKKWIEAFQTWAGVAKVDGAVGPNTMAALAKKMNMNEYERKIDKTMIARRGKKPFAPDMDFTDLDFLEQIPLEELRQDEDRYAFYKELKEQVQKNVSEYTEKMVAMQNAYPNFNNLPDKEQESLLTFFDDTIIEHPNENPQTIATRAQEYPDYMLATNVTNTDERAKGADHLEEGGKTQVASTTSAQKKEKQT